VRTATACLLLVFLAGCAPAPAVLIAEAPAAPDDRPAPGAPAFPPYAFTHFCLRYAEDCRVQDTHFEEGHGSLGQLADVNAAVNGKIAPRANRVRMSYDSWRIAPPSGDCNDYAVTKRHDLLRLGWPSRSLLLAEAVTPHGEHHLVLVVKSEGRDLVLDNLTDIIRESSDTSYEWVRMQSPDNPKNWIEMGA